MPTVAGSATSPVGQARRRAAACRSPRRRRSAAPRAAWSARSTGAAWWQAKRRGERAARGVRTCGDRSLGGERRRSAGADGRVAPARAARCARSITVSTHDQRGSAAGVRDRGRQRPAEQRRCRARWPAASASSPTKPSAQRSRRRSGAVQAPRERRERGAAARRRAEPVRHVDRGQRRERQVAAAGRRAELAQQREAWPKSIARPPAALAGAGSRGRPAPRSCC